MQETQEMWVQSLSREDPCRKKWQPTPVFLPGESHGQRSLAGYSSWGGKELDMTEGLNNKKPGKAPYQAMKIKGDQDQHYAAP